MTIGPTTEQHNLIAKTFGVNPAIRTEGKFGVFQASVIFKEYLYNDHGLRAALKPHYFSLYVPTIGFGYACVLVLGAIMIHGGLRPSGVCIQNPSSALG